MCKVYDTKEIMSVIDEVASSAASLATGGAQSYETFVKSREKCNRILEEYNSYISTVQAQITSLSKIV